ncbi:MAG TPA: helix-turn-helix domain-containing protein [Candidatus Sulfotelmatobacter sp.]|nr:helix-turn-helix domain-containing protein [Candidatus Sulfotelmatobacter sp.]
MNARQNSAQHIPIPLTEQSRPPAPGPDVLLTPAELAARLAVPQSWVREKTRERARQHDRDPLPVVRLGKYVRFSWAAVQAWLARQGA